MAVWYTPQHAQNPETPLFNSILPPAASHKRSIHHIMFMCHRRAQTGLLVQNQFSNKLISYSFGSLCICNQLSHESVLRRNIEGHFWCFSAPRLCFVLDRNVGNISYLWKETLSLGGRQKNLFFVGFSEQLHSYEPAHSYCLNCILYREANKGLYVVA